MGCRLDRGKQAATRIMHEASLHDFNCFATFTYAPDKLHTVTIYEEDCPTDQLTLNKVDFQLFMKKLRKKVKNENFTKSIKGKDSDTIRFYATGEYGDKFGRPHFHAVFLGQDFRDKRPEQLYTGGGVERSRSLENVWEYGTVVVGDLTIESADYVARYVTKKLSGPEADKRYDGRAREFALQSKGIGYPWFTMYHNDLRFYDRAIVEQNGSFLKRRIPRYYDKKTEEMNPKRMEEIRAKRKEKLDQVDLVWADLVRKENWLVEYHKRNKKRSFENGTHTG